MAVIRQPRSQLNQTVQRLLAMLMSDKQMKQEYSQRSDLSSQAAGQNMELETERTKNDKALETLKHQYKLSEQQAKVLDDLAKSSPFQTLMYYRNKVATDPTATQEDKDALDKAFYRMADEYGRAADNILRGKGTDADHSILANFGEQTMNTALNQGGSSMRDFSRMRDVDIPGVKNRQRELGIEKAKETRLREAGGEKGKVTQAEIVQGAIKSMESRGVANKSGVTNAANLPDSYKDPATYGKVMSTLSGLLNKIQKDPNSLTDEEMQWISNFAMTAGEANKSGFRAPGEKPATAMDNISGLVEKIKAILGQVGGAIGGGDGQAPQSQGAGEDTAVLQGKTYRVGEKTPPAPDGKVYEYAGNGVWKVVG
jgi:hypothetical protein